MITEGGILPYIIPVGIFYAFRFIYANWSPGDIMDTYKEYTAESAWGIFPLALIAVAGFFGAFLPLIGAMVVIPAFILALPIFILSWFIPETYLYWAGIILYVVAVEYWLAKGRRIGRRNRDREADKQN